MPDKQHTPTETRLDCDVVVLGAGPGGYSAAFRCADLGLRTVLVERHATLGGVCLNVGCIPSKALLHVAAVIGEADALAAHGVDYAAPEIDRQGLATWKQKVVGKLTTGLAAMARMRKVTVLRGEGRFIDPQRLAVHGEDGTTTVAFGQAIIATGSRAVTLPFLPDDPRIVTSTGALALDSVPKRMLVIGGGIIGLELATVYAALGTRIDVVEMQDGLMAGADRDLVKVWEKHNAKRFDRILLNTRTVGAEALPEGIRVSLEGPEGPLEPQLYDLVLVAVGRRPNGDDLGAEAAGVTVGAGGFIAVDEQMRTNVPHIFAIGDVVGQPMLAHKAVHEAHLAAEVAAGLPRLAKNREIPSVAYTDPEVAWVGVTEESARRAGRTLRKAVFPWAASGRAIANGREEGFTKLLVDPETLRIVGGAIVGVHAGDLIGELCLAIQMGCTPRDLSHTIHPHPTLCESVGLAAEVFEGVCTDLPPQRRS